ncbi:unnamed protein product [Parnassius apollo]|uniref:(apollo) hypothetical protein n=1 Tax=Parnassius apollo TaxID=110799 RepID=A0A8S3W367_PARAO|nr:unnamed protein product [Parnassius apollo]
MAKKRILLEKLINLLGVSNEDKTKDEEGGSWLCLISRALSNNLVLKSPATSIDNFGTGEQTCCSSNSAIDSIRANPDNEACCSISTANGSISISPIDQACCSTTTINDNIGHDKNVKEICNNSSSSSSPSGTEFDSDDSVKDKDYVPPQKKEGRISAII